MSMPPPPPETPPPAEQAGEPAESFTPGYHAGGVTPGNDARAGFWRRFAGAFIDGILVGIVSGILGAIAGNSARYGIGTPIGILYATLMIGSARGQTVGQMALGIRVIGLDNGESIGYGRAFIRALVSIVSALVFLLGYLWMLWDKEKQCWHDKAANDVVVPVQS